MLLINLQWLNPNDPIRHLNKVKLGLYGRPADKMYDSVVLITMEGKRIPLAENISNEDLILKLDQLINITEQATTVLVEQKSLYRSYQYLRYP